MLSVFMLIFQFINSQNRIIIRPQRVNQFQELLTLFGEFHLRKMDYISENQFAICITQDNRDEIRKIVSESTNVKFPEKRQQLLDMIDSMGPDDNPILAIYKLKD